MTLVVPGVQVTVVKEVLPQQPTPSGILGIIGFTEKIPARIERASSFSRLVDVFGAATAYSLPEARKALDNGVYELVVSPLDAEAGDAASVEVDKPGTPPGKAFRLVARANGLWANGLEIKIAARPKLATTQEDTFDLVVQRPGPSPEILERYRDLKAANLVEKLSSSSFILAEAIGDTTPIALPKDGDYKLAGGQDANRPAYAKASHKPKEKSDVDMVLAAVQDFSNTATLAEIYGDVISHCNLMAGECKGRIGFGQVPANAATATCVQIAQNVNSDRFVLVAPNGVVGAVAGLVGNLPYFHSPTFKRVSGLGEITAIGIEDQRALLSGRVVPIALERSLGIVVLRGLTTDGDQISVRRVADRAVRTMKEIGNKFIGLLNNADGRAALRSKLVEALTQMQKDGAIVPSTDGVDPAFKVNVYSSQADFGMGIVRVDMAVRPVRAIDYIYATITIQV